MEPLVILHTCRIDAQTENVSPTLTNHGWCVTLPYGSAEMVDRMLQGVPCNLLQHVKHVILTNHGDHAAKQQIHEDIWNKKHRSRPLVSLQSIGTVDLREIFKHTAPSLNVFSVYTACSSGIKGLHLLEQLLQSTDDLAIVLAYESGSVQYLRHIFDSVGATSKDPVWAPPLTSNANGTMLGDGAALMIVSKQSTADKLGVSVKACIDSIGFATVPTHFTRPSQQDIVHQLIVDTIERSGKSDFVLWDAHATGTVIGDTAEKTLHNAILPHVPIYSHKAVAGHTLSASSLVETVAAIDRLSGSTQQTFLKCGFGFGGQNGVMVVTTL